MANRICIPDYEYKERAQRVARLIEKNNLDVLIVNSNEADYANVRYFSGFWPLFERAGLAITPQGKTALMVGPESRVYASDFSRVQDIFMLMEYRESADPSYPEVKAERFQDVFSFLGVNGSNLRIGVASLLDTSVVTMQGIRDSFPKAEIVDANHIMIEMRKIKSENEIACMREGFRITEIATREVIKAIRPGVTECQMVGVAQKAIYENGAEYEGLPMYVFSEASTRHAISRSSHREIKKGDIVQLNLSAKVDGYSPSVGLPISMGKLSPERRAYIDFCWEAHQWTEKQLKAGVLASDVAKGFYKFYKDSGHESNYLYGPCHGTGMIEVEAPWMETISDYVLEPNMTFQIDTFITTDTFGARWEKGIVIKEDGIENLCEAIGTLHELDF
ncbi:Xaa-Pro aminopeptidase [Anaerobacterium chartisolvens]|uniref:Xaa-Pro aminopeptidase n=1 Tax=Anaerobacterium chartisolvens TaxID=1297424 RepID=A0A369B7M8_9FIRM|nr:Xaa-Pro peptidase family protein [Anaerobacterium chartisolvens]RCX16537.1 Xaa-Pro aminopeptidase [Anaerobacterium chartisolvens]